MKKLHYVLCYLAVIFAGLCFSSCSSDDDRMDDASMSNSDIIGTWKTTCDYYSGTVNYLMLCSNGIAYEITQCAQHGVEVNKYNYTYNSKKEVLILDAGWSVNFDIISITSSKMTLINRHNDTATYSKIKGINLTTDQLDELYNTKHFLCEFSFFGI